MHTGSQFGAGAVGSGTGSPEEDDEAVPVSHESLRVGLVLHRSSDGYATRVNTLNSFLDANRRV
jgi:hypothetical protein